MEIIVYIFAKAVEIFLSVMLFMMLVRVVLQFFPNAQSSKLNAVCIAMTEPIILPIRLLFAKLNIAQNLPIDVPFMVGYLVLWLITGLLPAI